jgi:hypothetical protein
MNFLKTLLLTMLVAFGGTAQAFELVELEAGGSFDLNGAWYDPSESGYGILFDNEPASGTFMALFTYEFYTEAPGQAWYVAYTEHVNDSNTFSQVFYAARAVGEFPAGDNQQTLEPTVRITVTALDANTLHVEWHFIQEAPCTSPRVSPSPPFCDGEAVFVRLLPDVVVEEG